MYKYDPKSSIADEFINDAEILESLAYASENKANKQVIDAILQKATKRRRFFWNVNWKRKIRKLKNLQKRLKSGFMASEL